MMKVCEGFEIDVHGTKRKGCNVCGRITDCYKVRKNGKDEWLCPDCLKEEEDVRI